MANECGSSEPFPGGEAGEIYRIFDTPLRSHLPLPELPVVRDAEPRIAIRKVKYGQLDLEGFAVCHTWQPDRGPPICSTARRGDDYLLTFPERAAFHISAGAVISCLPAPGSGDELVRQLLLSQVLPRFLGHRGELLLHASAVTLGNGKTVAFLGESGHGKSTLASYCHQRGAELIDDDCIHLRFVGSRLHITGGVPTLRLYPDSQRALGHDATGFESYRESPGKQQLLLPPGTTTGSQARVLDALILLAPPEDENGVDEIQIVPATGQMAMMSILSSAFTLDPTDTLTMTRTFAHAGRALENGVDPGVKLLRYPRDYDRLGQVWDALLACLSGPGG